MVNRERAMIFACAGPTILSLVVLGAFALFSARPIWIPTAAGNEVFDSNCAWTMAAVIPIGALSGLLVDKSVRVGLSKVLAYWMAGCAVGAIAFFQIVMLSGVINPLWISGVGLIVVPLALWIANKYGGAKPLPQRP